MVWNKDAKWQYVIPAWRGEDITMARILNRAIMVLYAAFCFMYLGCDMNTSVDFIVEEPQTQSENNVDFSADWELGVPLYYFTGHPHTIFYLKIETNEHIADVLLPQKG
jgi:hypothetical protein